MEREKGFESDADCVSSSLYAVPDVPGKVSRWRAEASRHVDTELRGDDNAQSPSALLDPTPDLFISAGAVVADRAAREGAQRSKVEELLRRAVDQATALRGDAA